VDEVLTFLVLRPSSFVIGHLPLKSATLAKVANSLLDEISLANEAGLSFKPTAKPSQGYTNRDK
jgi:hypothetical protein